MTTTFAAGVLFGIAYAVVTWGLIQALKATLDHPGRNKRRKQRRPR